MVLIFLCVYDFHHPRRGAPKHSWPYNQLRLVLNTSIVMRTCSGKPGGCHLVCRWLSSANGIWKYLNSWQVGTRSHGARHLKVRIESWYFSSSKHWIRKEEKKKEPRMVHPLCFRLATALQPLFGVALRSWSRLLMYRSIMDQTINPLESEINTQQNSRSRCCG